MTYQIYLVELDENNDPVWAPLELVDAPGGYEAAHIVAGDGVALRGMTRTVMYAMAGLRDHTWPLVLGAQAVQVDADGGVMPESDILWYSEVPSKKSFLDMELFVG